MSLRYPKLLRQLRTEAHKSQAELAEVLGTSQTMYARYERGANELPLRHLLKLADYYGVSADYLLGLSDAAGRSVDRATLETLAAGLAAGGAHPVYGVYGTFLQRAYDQIWHDVCLNAAPVTILVFGSSAFGTTDLEGADYRACAAYGAMYK